MYMVWVYTIHVTRNDTDTTKGATEMSNAEMLYEIEGEFIAEMGVEAWNALTIEAQHELIEAEFEAIMTF